MHLFYEHRSAVLIINNDKCVNWEKEQKYSWFPHLQFFCLQINLFAGLNFLGKAEYFPYRVPELQTFHAIVITRIDMMQLKKQIHDFLIL